MVIHTLHQEGLFSSAVALTYLNNFLQLAEVISFICIKNIRATWCYPLLPNWLNPLTEISTWCLAHESAAGLYNFIVDIYNE